MRAYKKLRLFFIFTFITTVALIPLGTRVASAQPVNENTLKNGTYKVATIENSKPKSIDAVIAGRSFTFTDSNTKDNTINFKTDGRSGFICSQGDNKHLGITLDLPPKNASGGGKKYSGFIDVNYSTDSNKNQCGTDEGGDGTYKNSDEVPITATQDSTVQDVGNTDADGNSLDACGENTHGLQLAWLICPAIDAMGGLTDGLIGLFESQLSFTVSQNLGNADSQARVKTTWSLMKNLASAFLVIIMLLMVFAQAFGGGPMDAYTVKKMLPRLVVAVIAIQVSWYIAAWIIDFVNAIGNGIADLLFLPFGGSGKMHLGNLLDNAKIGAEYTGPAGWLGMAAVIGFGIADLPMLLLLLLGAVVALVAALITLMFRKILIIMLLVLVPLALLAWILPGTQRYWKMWSDNFMKALFMFPLVVALVAAGRIFAYVAGTQDNSTFLNFFMVMVGYFGPLFIIPKSFKWGGQMMQMAGNGINQGLNKISSPGKSYLQGLHQRSRWMLAKQTRENIRMHQARQGFAQGLQASGVRGTINRARLVRPGRPSSEREVIRRALQSAQTESGKAYEEELQGANAEITQQLLPNYDRSNQDLVREAIALRQTRTVTDVNGNTIRFDGDRYATEHPMTQRAALDRAVAHGQWAVVDQYYTEAIRSGDANRIREAEFFKQANAPALAEALPHVLKSFGVAVNSKEGQIAKMSGHGIESIIAEYSTRAAAGDAQAARDLSGFLQRYQNARSNDALRGDMDVRGIQAVDAFIGASRGDPAAQAIIDEINTGAGAEARATASAASRGLSPEETEREVLMAVRESSRTHYQSPGLYDPNPQNNQTLPLIQY